MSSVAGFNCKIRRGGTPTAMTAEAMTAIGGGRYQITAAARRCIDPNLAFHITQSAATLPYAEITAANFEFGEVTTATVGTTTVTGFFIPLGTADILSEVKGFSLSESTDLLDRTVFLDGVPLRRRIPGLADASVSLDMFVDQDDLPDLRDIYENGEETMLEVDYGATELFRGWGVIESLERSGAVDGLIELSVTWNLSAQRNPATGLVSGYSDRALLST